MSATLISEYEDKAVTLDKLVAAQETMKKAKSDVCKRIHDEIGKGPHKVRGEDMIIAVRGDVYFFIPMKKKKDG